MSRKCRDAWLSIITPWSPPLQYWLNTSGKLRIISTSSASLVEPHRGVHVISWHRLVRSFSANPASTSSRRQVLLEPTVWRARYQRLPLRGHHFLRFSNLGFYMNVAGKRFYREFWRWFSLWSCLDIWTLELGWRVESKSNASSVGVSDSGSEKS
jgi:hypothetical protein